MDEQELDYSGVSPSRFERTATELREFRQTAVVKHELSDMKGEIDKEFESIRGLIKDSEKTTANKLLATWITLSIILITSLSTIIAALLKLIPG